MINKLWLLFLRNPYDVEGDRPISRSQYKVVVLTWVMVASANVSLRCWVLMCSKDAEFLSGHRDGFYPCAQCNPISTINNSSSAIAASPPYQLLHLSPISLLCSGRCSNCFICVNRVLIERYKSENGSWETQKVLCFYFNSRGDNLF